MYISCLICPPKDAGCWFIYNFFAWFKRIWRLSEICRRYKKNIDDSLEFEDINDQVSACSE